MEKASMKESFLNPFRTRLMNYCFIVVSVGFIAAISGYFIKKINIQPSPILTLDGEWKVCAGEECRMVKVPATEDHPFPESASYKHLRYSRNFKTPEVCLEGNCAILFSEIADAGEIRINGQRVAIHGGIGKDFVFSKHYPVFESVNPSLFKKDNLIEVFVETAKIPQSGIRGELSGFYPYKEAKAYVLGRYVYDIFTPIAGAILLLVLCLYTIRKIYRATETRPDLQALSWVLSSMALVLISSSNVPREFLPTWVCAYGHFLLKHAVDWSLFYLAYVFYRERFAVLRWMNWWVYFSVAIFMISVFVAQLLLPAMARENHSVMIPFVAMQVLFPLRILPFGLMFI